MKKTLFIVIALLIITAVPVSAATFKVSDAYEYTGNGDVGDMYIAGGAIDISGDITGDGVIAGGDISILGNVSQDMMLAGGSVRLLGSVGDDARVVGGNITVSSNVADDLVVVGGLVRILSDTTVLGDMVVVGGSVIMNGSVAGDLTIYAEEVVINGPVSGNVVLHFAKKITFGEGSLIAGNLTYSGREDLEIGEGVIVGGTITRVDSPMKQFELNKGDMREILGFFFFIKLALMLITGVLAVLVFRRFSKTVGVETYESFWKNTLIGFITLIVVPFATLLLFATVIGAYLGVILLGVYALMLIVSKVFTGIVAGALLSKWIKKEIIVDWKWVILGIIALQALCFVPFIGSLLGFIVVLATFGTIGMLVYKNLWLNR
ncbi:MAG: hypothetical protein WD509_03225 [Candidatus Paceibacterota bacterium]